MTKKPYTIQIFLTGLILLSYSSTTLAQSSPYITDRGLIELENILDESLAEIAKENGYTLDRDYTYLAIPDSNVAIIFAGGVVAGIMIGSIAIKTLTFFNMPYAFRIVPLIFLDLFNVFSISIANGITILLLRTDAPHPYPCQDALQNSTTSTRTDDAPNAIDPVNVIKDPELLEGYLYAAAVIFVNHHFLSNSSELFALNDLRYNPNPNRLEVHYKVTSDTDPQDHIENSCFVHLARQGDRINGEVDACVWGNIFRQETPGSVRIGEWHDGIMGQKKVVTKFSIHDPVY